MAGSRGSGSVPSLPPPRPKSPPEYPDLYGKRRELAKVQMLEREIGFLEEELKSIEGLQPASKSCKEVADFVTANADPLIPTTKKIRRSCRFWKWLCGGVSCFNVSWISCCSCTPHLKMPGCCCCCGCCGNCNICNCCSNPCANCRLPKCDCFSCCNSKCCNKSKCGLQCCCCIPKCSSCSTCSCTRCTCYPKCPNLNISSCCCKRCCYPCYFCY